MQKNTRNKNKKLRVGVFYGGPSKEHDVSISSAKAILQNIDKDKYRVVGIKISKTGKWPKGYSSENIKNKIDFALIAMHGAYGEDGTIQAIFESASLPYSGSKVMSSSLAMDKYRSQILVKSLGVATPRTWLIGYDPVVVTTLPKELVIKPNNSGSSEGVMLISKSSLLKEKNWQKKYEGQLLQQRIYGRELTAPVLAGHTLPIIEIISQNQIYDYEAKYVANMSKHVLNPKLPNILSNQLTRLALVIHNLLDCRVMSRSDFLLSGNRFYYLETNTIPGMTGTSLFPEAAQSLGISYTKLINKIIKLS